MVYTYGAESSNLHHKQRRGECHTESTSVCDFCIHDICNTGEVVMYNKTISTANTYDGDAECNRYVENDSIVGAKHNLNRRSQK